MSRSNDMASGTLVGKVDHCSHSVLPDRSERRQHSTDTYRPVAAPFRMSAFLAGTFRAYFQPLMVVVHAPSLQMRANSSGSRLAPPTSAPSISGWAMSSAMFDDFTLPPY